MRLWHATAKKNLESIMFQGIKPFLGEIYLADSAEWAATFIAMRGEHQIVAFPVDLPIRKIKESFDHNPNFFKCKCYTYNKAIPPRKIDWKHTKEWNLPEKKHG